MARESGELRKSLDVDEAVKRAMRLAQFSLERAAEAIFWMGPDARFVYVNETACRLLGYSREELLSMTVHDIDPEFVPEVWRAQWEDLERRGSLVTESYYRTKDGRILPVEIAANSLEFDGQEYSCTFVRDITERKNAEDALQESEERYRTLLKNIPQKIFYKDLNSVYVLCNESYAGDLKVKPDEIIGKTDYDFYSKELADKYRGDDKRVMESGTPEEIEEKYVKDGQEFVVRTFKAPVRDEKGDIIGIFGVFWDITEHKRRENLLKASEANYRTIFNAANDAIFVHDVKTGAIADVNEKMCEMYGYSVEEARQLKVEDISSGKSPYSQEEGVKWIRKAARGEPQLFEWLCKDKEGRSFWVEVNLKQAMIGGENRVLAVVRDITARKQAELALRMSEQRFRAIADYTYDWENWISPKGRLLWVNPAVARITGYTVEECMAMPDFPIPLVCEEDREKVGRTFREALKGGMGEDFEFRIRRKDGRVIWVAVSWQPIYDNKGSCQGHRSSIRDITDRKYAEIALGESRQMLQLVLDTIPARVFWKDRNSAYLGCNQRFAGDAGLNSPEEIIGKNDFDLSWEEQGESYRSDDRQVIESEVRKLNYEEPFRSPDGQLRWIRTSKIPLRDADGNVIGVMGTYEDISEHKQAERELQASEQRYRDLVETMNEGLGVVDENYIFTYVNTKFTKMLGYSENEMVGHHITEFLDEENKKIMDKQITKRRRGEAETFDLVWTTKDGRKVYTIASPKGIFDSEGNFKGSFGVLTDITARKQAEEQILKLAKFPDENPYPVLRVSADGIVLYGNNSSKALLNFWGSEIGSHISYEKRQIIVDALASGQPKQAEAKYKDRVFSLTFAPVAGFNYVNVYALDITERKRAEVALDRLNRELEAKNQELESILYVASHDLRSPLVNILGFSHELSRSNKLLHSALAAKRDVLADMGKEVQVAFDERVPEALGFISASAKKMDSLLSGLLRLCRLGYAAMNIERVDMNAMMSSITASMEYQIKESGATVEVEALPPCVGDAEQLNQVFSNLLDNAVKYLDDSRPGLIRIYGRTEQGRNIYCVEDNGIGIAPEHQGKIFEVFHRLEPDKHAGEGLGLSIVRRILNRHNGEVWVESAPGEGSKFFMSLPGS